MTSQANVVYRMIPHVTNPSFFGRKDELKTLDRILLSYNKSRLSIVSVIGEGGIGKSQLALKFAYAHFDKFSAIFWIPASSSLKLAKGYEDIAVEAGLANSSGEQGSLSTVRETVKKWLRTTDHTWLLIFDNIESMASLNDYWPAGGFGSIVITTQNQNLIQSPITTSLALKCFTKQEGTRFLLDNIPETAKNFEKAIIDATQICDVCGGLPLALSQVIRYIRSRHTSVADARELCSTAESFVNIHSDLNQLSPPDYYHHLSISLLWEQSLQSLNPACTDLVGFLAHLDPDGIPEDFWKTDPNREVQARFESSVEKDRNVLTLLEHSLMSRGATSANYSMHRLIQATILNRLNKDERTSFFELALSIMNKLFPEYDDSDRLLTSWTECGVILQHVVRLANLFPSSSAHDASIYLKLGQLFERASWYPQERGMRNDAVRLLETALDVSKKGMHLTSEESTDTKALASSFRSSAWNTSQELKKLVCDVTNSLGMLELKRGQFDKALHHFLDAFKMRSALGAVDEELIYMKRNAGIAHLSANRVDEAFAAFQESMSLREEQLATVENRDPYRDNLASNYGSLSCSLMAMDRLDEAWEAAMKSTELCKQAHSPESAILADCYTTLGIVRRAQGRPEDAEPLLLKALDIRTKFYGQHEETALSLHNYATILKQTSKNKEAFSDMKAAVHMLHQLPDAKHILARSRFYLSTYQKEEGDSAGQGNEDEAFKLYQEQAGQTAKEKSSLSKEDFDNFLVHYWR